MYVQYIRRCIAVDGRKCLENFLKALKKDEPEAAVAFLKNVDVNLDSLTRGQLRDLYEVRATFRIDNGSFLMLHQNKTIIAPFFHHHGRNTQDRFSKK
jgi:hypothetical protein